MAHVIQSSFAGNKSSFPLIAPYNWKLLVKTYTAHIFSPHIFLQTKTKK